jgi:hypothetical protein
MKKPNLNLPLTSSWEKLWYFLSVLTAAVSIYFINPSPYSAASTLDFSFPFWLLVLFGFNGITICYYLN